MADGRALVARIRVMVVDANNIKGEAIAYVILSGSGRLTDITDCLQEFIGWVDDVTGGRIIEARCELYPPLPGGLKSSPEAGVNTALTGNMVFHLDGTSRTFGVSIPALKNTSDVVDAGNLVVSPGSPVGNLINFLITSPATFNFTNDNGQDLVSFKQGYFSFRQHAEQQAVASTRLA